MKGSMGGAWAVFAAVLFLLPAAASAGPADYPGWERGGDYDSRYKVSEYDSFKGAVKKVEVVTPMPGMAPGVAVVVTDEEGTDVEVQLGPRGFVDEKATGFKAGDKVKVKGVWAEIGGKEVFLASKVKKGDLFQLKVRRTKDGMPFWAMTAGELEKEKAEE